ncbi:MAG: shikimate dehydrogenase [Halofilum sp. (in: g-proteobacteria)]|nr:shikimate dehydrogenase [Halofilum sp. (in: g-proteobacteria)]
MPTDRYAVIGHPVDHSLSPTIHAAFASATGEDLVYDRIDAPPDGFAAAAEAFFADRGRGLNVTVPFKAEAFTWCTHASARALRAGVVNTLSAEAGGLVAGDNTDGIGLVRDLVDNVGLTLAGAHVLLVGAGGAARGVLGPLLGARPARVTIANRTATRAHELAAAFADAGDVTGSSFEALAGAGPFDLVINASAASLGGSVPPLPAGILRPGATVYDMMYGDRARPFLEWGRAAGATSALDGLGMLVEQAAESFLVWRRVRPETGPVLARLRAAGGG